MSDNLILKTVSTDHDIERLHAFNDHIHGQGVGGLSTALIRQHPTASDRHNWPFIEDTDTGDIVSTLCLIPWTLRLEDVELKAGEMGIVGTLEDYRRRGLIRRLVEVFDQLLLEGAYDLSHIQGIPYYYRHFGYEYAIPLEGGWRVELHELPQAESGYRIRLATQDDIPRLVAYYNAAQLPLHAERDAAIWAYMLGPSTQTEYAAETYMVLDAEGTPVGYFKIMLQGFGEALIVSEGSNLSADAALAVLDYCKGLATERHKPAIRLNMPTSHVLVQVGRRFGAHELGNYAWQIRFPHVAQLLQKLGPAFERRLAASPFAGLTRAVTINLYRAAYGLTFAEGRLMGVETLGFHEGGDLSLPPTQLVPLLLGYRSLDEIQASYPDASAQGLNSYLIDVLFPKMEGYLYCIY